MKKKIAKKTNKPKAVASKKAAPKKVVKKSNPAAKKAKPVAKKSKPVAKKAAPAKKKLEKKVVKTKQKPVAKKTMKKPEPKKIKAPIKKAPVVVAKKVAAPVKQVAKPAPKTEVKVMPVAKVEPKKVVAEKPKVSDANEKKNYNEKELGEFRVLIVGKLDQARKDYDLLKNTLCHTDDHGTDDTSPTFKALEDGSDVLTREETAQLALRQEKFIQNLQNALVRIQNKTYGICRVTGKLIPKERLMRVPHATLSIDAKMVQQFNQ
jgi:RNA polymerase-binding transcription factor DksA